MELSNTRFQAVNVGSDFEQPEDISEYFTLQAPPNTHIWRKPSEYDDTTAPMLLTRLRQSFILAEVTVSADFQMEWDQAGLVIFAGALPSQRPRTPIPRRIRRYSPYENTIAPGSKWVKAGLEFTGGTINVSSVVATSACGSDWATAGCMPFRPYYDSYASSQVRLKFERVDDALWIWFRIVDTSPSTNDHESPESVGARWIKMREVMGFFGGREEKGNVWVGCYASRPMNWEPSNTLEEAGSLIAEFEDLDIL